MSFPTHHEQLTNTWLSEALGYPVEDHRVEVFGEGTSIIGMVTRVHLTSATGPASIIAKFPSPAAENRAVAATYDMYRREIMFYRDVAPNIDLRVPQCYYAEHDEAGEYFVLLMEDLNDWTIGDQVAGCTEEQATALVKGLAAFHANTWNTPLDIVSHNNPAQRDGMIGGFGVGWPVVCEQFAELIPTKGADLGDKVAPCVPRLLDEMTQAPVCIGHADVRLDNVFFKGDAIALVDWQSVCITAPEQDLAYFVTQSLPHDVRNAQDWVALYHQSLTEHLTSQGIEYSLEQCRARYRVCAAYLLCYAVIISGTLDLANERGMALGRTLFGNAMQALDELDAFALFDQ